MSKEKKKGYRLEKAIAEFFDGERKGTLGREDVSHKIFSIECKVKNNMPKGVTRDYDQATHHCPQGKIPMVVWHKDHQSHDNDFIIIQAGHFKSLLKKELEHAKSKKRNVTRVQTEEQE